jgi:hypothetical protein
MSDFTDAVEVISKQTELGFEFVTDGDEHVRRRIQSGGRGSEDVNLSFSRRVVRRTKSYVRGCACGWLVLEY